MGVRVQKCAYEFGDFPEIVVSYGSSDEFWLVISGLPREMIMLVEEELDLCDTHQRTSRLDCSNRTKEIMRPSTTLYSKGKLTVFQDSLVVLPLDL